MVPSLFSRFFFYTKPGPSFICKPCFNSSTGFLWEWCISSWRCSWKFLSQQEASSDPPFPSWSSPSVCFSPWRQQKRCKISRTLSDFFCHIWWQCLAARWRCGMCNIEVLMMTWWWLMWQTQSYPNTIWEGFSDGIWVSKKVFKLFRPQKTLPNAVVEGVWSCRDRPSH